MSALAVALQSGIPTITWGGPGVGKTKTVEALGLALGLTVETVIAAIREPSDFAGLPIIDGDSVRYAPPSWAKRLAAAGKGILFLDECSCAPHATQSALLRVILDRVVADLPLAKEVWVLAAANPPEMSAGGLELSPPLANRFCHLDWQVSADAWITGMISGWPAPRFPILPKDWETNHLTQANSLVASYIRHRPDKLNVVPANDSDAGRAYSTPRSWSMAATMLAACHSLGRGGDEYIATLVSGCVGVGAGLEFYTWVKDLDLPNPEALLKEPKSLKLPKRSDKVFAILNSVVAAVLDNLTAARWAAAWSVLEEACGQGHQDIAAAVCTTLAKERTGRAQAFAIPLSAAKFMPLLRLSGVADR